MNVVGLDLSLTSTGVAWSTGTVESLKTELKDEPRLIWLRNKLVETLEMAAADVVVLEGYSFGSKFSRGHAAGELGGVVKVELYEELQIPFAIVPPTVLKKYATGAGGGAKSSKEKVLIEAVKRFPDVAVTGSDEADALWLRAMGMHYYGEPLVEMPKDRELVLSSVVWPTLPQEGVAS